MIRAMSKRLCGLTWAAPSLVWVNRRFTLSVEAADDAVVNIAKHVNILFRFTKWNII